MAMIDGDRLVAVANTASSGALTASTSVDVATRIHFTQTTANITVSLPNPTLTAMRRVIVLQNLAASTQILHVGGSAANSDIIALAVGDVREMSWNGSSWKAVGTLRSLVLTASGQSGILGGVTWTMAAAGGNIATISTSVAMTGCIRSTMLNFVGAAFDYWVVSTGASGLLQRGSTWSGATTGTIGSDNSSYSCVTGGYLSGNGRTFRISGGCVGVGSPMAFIIEQVS